MKYPVVILHGWKKQGSDYHILQIALEKRGFIVYAPDMPGFGKEKLAKNPMTIDDYVQFIITFVQKEKVKKAIFICHSFGGRVGIKLSVLHPELIDKLIMTGVPGIREKLSYRKKILSHLSKLVKKIIGNNTFAIKIVYKLLNENDYYHAGSMKDTFVAVINEDLKEYLSQINVQTTLIWGEDDTFVSTSIAKQMHSLIKNSTYIEIPHTTHKLPYEDPQLFTKEIFSVITI